MIAYFTNMFGPAFGPVIGLAVVFVLLVLGLWILLVVFRRFRSGLFVSGGARGNAPRLAVTDAVPVDSHRRLVLVRRDDVEHLIMIGGPTDIVVEAGIGKPQPQAQIATPKPPAHSAQPLPAPPVAQQQRTPMMAARDAVQEAELGRPVRTVETQLPERRLEAPFVPPVTPPPAARAPTPQAPAMPESPPAQTATPARSSTQIDLDKLLDELRPNPVQDR